MDIQGHGRSGVSLSPEARIQDYQSKPRKNTLMWLKLCRAVATACCWGIVWPKPPSQRYSARAWAKQPHHLCPWGQNTLSSFFLLKWARTTTAGERETRSCNPHLTIAKDPQGPFQTGAILRGCTLQPACCEQHRRRSGLPEHSPAPGLWPGLKPTHFRQHPVSDEAEKVAVGEGVRESHLHYPLPSQHSSTFR